MARVIDARDEAAPRRPVLIKIAPDLDLRGLDDVVAVCAARGVDGMIVSNTTVARPSSLRDADAREAGGLSGRPLFEPSTRMLARTFLRCGALRADRLRRRRRRRSALAKIEAGASLVQIYTGMIYRGPGVIDEILDGLSRIVAVRGAGGLGDLVGVGARDWAASTG